MKNRKKQTDRELDMEVEYAGELPDKELDHIIQTLATMLIAHWRNKESDQQKNDITFKERS